MEMKGEQRIVAAQVKVWAALNDPEILRQCIPGCQSLEKQADNRMTAVANVKVGPIGAKFSGVVTLSELDPPNGYRIDGEGQGGAAGFAKGGARVRLSEIDASTTLLTYEVSAEVGGRLAQLGGPIIDATAKHMASAFFRKLSAVLAAQEESAPQVASVPPDVADAESEPRQAALPSVLDSRGPAVSVLGVLAIAIAVMGGFLLGREDANGWFDIPVLLAIVAAEAYRLGVIAGQRRRS